MKNLNQLSVAAIAVALTATTYANDRDRDRTLLVAPSHLNGWVYYTDGAPEGAFSFAAGPVIAQLGAGSLVLGVSDTTQRSVFATSHYAGVRLDDLTTLKYNIFRVTPDTGAVAPVLQLEVDYDLTDETTTSQGFLVYDPGLNGTITSGIWQTWDAFAGKWYMTGTAIKANLAAAQPFPLATPGTLTEILAQFPNAGVRATGNLSLKAGGAGGAVNAAVDAVVVGHDGGTTTWNFDPDTDRDSVPDLYDRYPNSDLRAKVDVGTGPTTVLNSVDDDGASIQDLVNKYQTSASSHKKYVKSISGLAKDLQKSGTITKDQAKEMKDAAEASIIPVPAG